MGKVFRLTFQLNFLLPCFGLLAVCICQHLILPAGPALLHRRTQSISLYVHAACTVGESWFHSHRRRIAPLPFSYLGCYLSFLIYIYSIYILFYPSLKTYYTPKQIWPLKGLFVFIYKSEFWRNSSEYHNKLALQYPNATVPICRTIAKCNCPHMPNNIQMQLLSPYAEQYPNATVPICRGISKCNCHHMPRNIQMQLYPYAEEYSNATVPVSIYAEEYPNATVLICRRIS